MALLLAPSVSLGAGLDADGAGLPVHDGHGTGLLSEAPALGAGTIAVGLRGALAYRPLVRDTVGGGAEQVVGQSLSARLQVVGMIAPWLGADLDLPLRVAVASDLEIGSGLGDARFNLWLRPSLRGPFRAGLGLGSQLPTGKVENFSGAGRGVPALRTSLAWDGPFAVSTSLGLAWEGALVADRALGGAVVDGGLRASYGADRFAIGTSVRLVHPLVKATRDRRGQSAEVGIDALVVPVDGWGVHGLLTRALTGGAGTPVWGGSVGLVFRFGEPPPPPPPKIVPMRRVQVVDPSGRAVAGAVASFGGGEERMADAAGWLEWLPELGEAEVTARGLGSSPTRRRGRHEVVLPWRPTPLEVRVATASGEPVSPKVRVIGLGPLKAAGEGRFQTSLLPGDWRLEVSSPGYGSQTRMLQVHPRQGRSVEIEVVLLPVEGRARLEIGVNDPQGQGISRAEVRLDGLSIGTTGEGRVGIEGLAPVPVVVEVDSRHFRSKEAEVDFEQGVGKAAFDLFYEPGTVRITATGPEGPISDGLIHIDGPRSLPSIRLGERGEKLVQLAEGHWDLALSSPAYGMQERKVVVEPLGPTPLNADFSLLPDRDGEAELVMRAVDVEGHPLEEVAMTVRGALVGRTGTGGELRLASLRRGPAVVTAVGEGLTEVSHEVDLRPGVQVVPLALSWEEGSVRIAAHSSEGPADAAIDFAGPSSYPSGRLGEEGRRLFTDVPPGEWEILASHSSGMEVAWATVGGQGGRLTDVAIAIGEERGDGRLELTVEDPLGRPIPGARVALDGVPLVTTANGGRVRVSGLRRGVRTIEVSHPLFRSLQVDLELTDDTSLTRTLAWREGLLDVRVRLAGETVSDGVLYFSGPRPIEPVVLGADGASVVAVGRGTWDLLVSSPSAGLAEEHLVIGTKALAPKRVNIELASSPGTVVTVVDPRGQPVSGVILKLNGAVVGTTSDAGIAVIGVDEPGMLLVEHAGMLPIEPIEISTGQPEQLVEIRWAPREVRVIARHQGEPTRISLTMNGPGRLPMVDLDGSGTIGLPPGRWELLASGGEGLGTVRQFVDVPLEGEVAEVVFDLEAARVHQTDVGLELDVKFALGQDMASTEFAPLLEEIAATIVADPRIQRVEVHGHTDSSGGPRLNFALSRRRAESVVKALIELGVPPSLLVARGYGPSRPVASNEEATGRAKNRRVDFLTVLADVE